MDLPCTFLITVCGNNKKKISPLYIRVFAALFTRLEEHRNKSLFSGGGCGALGVGLFEISVWNENVLTA